MILSDFERQKPNITPKQRNALESLLTQPTIRAAAAESGISEATLRRWLNDPVFSAAFTEARERLFEGTLTALQKASGDAVKCLHTIVNDEDAPASVRVNAAGKVLDLALRSREQLYLTERLQKLEQIISEKAKLGLYGVERIP